MKKRKIAWPVFFFCVLFLGRTGYCGENWKLVMHRGGIDAYSRQVPGSDVMETRAVTVIPAGIDVLAQVMRDVPNHPKWRPACKEVRVVRRPDRDSMVVYDVTGLPWPLSDRDEVLLCAVTVDEDRARGVANLSTVEEPDIPPRKDRVRIKELYANYVLQYLGKNRTGIVFTTRVNPAGKLPLFLVNSFSKYYAYMQLKALKKAAQDPHYVEMAKTCRDRELIEHVLRQPGRGKQVFANILAEFIKDKGFVDLIISERRLFDETFQGGLESGDTGEILLYGWGSHKAKKEAAASLLRAYLQAKKCDPALEKKMVSDDALLEAIVTGGTCLGKTPRQMIEANLGPKPPAS